LIASFKATLEEARQADLLLHVADASNPAALEQIAVVYKVLEELSISEKDALLVLNKVDQTDRGHLAAIRNRYPNAVPISAFTGEGVDRLSLTVSQALSHNFLDLDVETGVENGRLLAMLSSHGEVLSKRYTDSRVIVHCRVPQRAMGHFRGVDAQIRPHGLPQADGNQHPHGLEGTEEVVHGSSLTPRPHQTNGSPLRK
jgi:GTP-binding protein HflX